MIQDKARALKRHPREDDRNTLEAERVRMRVQFDSFTRLGAQVIHGTPNIIIPPAENQVSAFDDLEEEPGDDEAPNGRDWPAESTSSAAPDTPPSDLSNDNDQDIIIRLVQPENVHLPLPSAMSSRQTIPATIELRLRKVQAERHLQNLRELIAEKSFLYSHVIRVAPRKAVRTRARTNIQKLNLSITHVCRAYSRSRLALIRLGAAEHRYPVLLKTDIKASTAILDPNLPGAGTSRLSWIWQVSGERSDSPESLSECEHYLHLSMQPVSSLIRSYQFVVFTFFVPGHKSIDGQKSCFW